MNDDDNDDDDGEDEDDQVAPKALEKTSEW